MSILRSQLLGPKSFRWSIFFSQRKSNSCLKFIFITSDSFFMLILASTLNDLYFMERDTKSLKISYVKKIRNTAEKVQSIKWKHMCWLVSLFLSFFFFWQLDISMDYLGRNNLNRENTSIRLT